MPYLILVAIVSTVGAQLVRDRALWLQLLMYIPIGPLALSAICWDGLRRGRALPVRWLLLLVGVLAAGFAIALHWRPARTPEGSSSQRALRIAQWNTQWGGSRGFESLNAIVDALLAQDPEIVCLSEAPYPPHLEAAWNGRRAGWNELSVRNSLFSSYWYQLTVLSPHPIALKQEWTLSTGHAALFEVDLEPGRLRIMMVDLKSAPKLPRSGSLREVAALVAAASVPVDLVLGDFNTPGNFVGFDALAAAGEGYERAALWSGQWRGTWPSRLPLSPLDIDHVWVRSALDVASSALFKSRASDHRGQLTVLRLPRPE